MVCPEIPRISKDDLNLQFTEGRYDLMFSEVNFSYIACGLDVKFQPFLFGDFELNEILEDMDVYGYVSESTALKYENWGAVFMEYKDFLDCATDGKCIVEANMEEIRDPQNLKKIRELDREKYDTFHVLFEVYKFGRDLPGYWNESFGEWVLSLYNFIDKYVSYAGGHELRKIDQRSLEITKKTVGILSLHRDFFFGKDEIKRLTL